MTDEQTIRDAIERFYVDDSHALAALDRLVAERDTAERDVGALSTRVEELLARAEAAEKERDSLMDDSWRAYVISGSDTDMNERWHCDALSAGRSLVGAIEQLRSDYNESLDDAREAVREIHRAVDGRLAAEARCATLEAALTEAGEWITEEAGAEGTTDYWGSLLNRLDSALAAATPPARCTCGKRYTCDCGSQPAEKEGT